MTPKIQAEPDLQTAQRPRQPRLARSVLYADDPREGLLLCGRAAYRHGDRIVSAASEGEDRRVGRQALYALIERMLEGEFDTIVAAVRSNAPNGQPSRLVRLYCGAVEQ